MLLGLASPTGWRPPRPRHAPARLRRRPAGRRRTHRARRALGPPELRLGGRLNELGERIDGLLTAERERGADLAHRLRTPVAALRLDAEGLRDADEARGSGRASRRWSAASTA